MTDVTVIAPPGVVLVVAMDPGRYVAPPEAVVATGRVVVLELAVPGDPGAGAHVRSDPSRWLGRDEGQLVTMDDVMSALQAKVNSGACTDVKFLAASEDFAWMSPDPVFGGPAVGEA